MHTMKTISLYIFFFLIISGTAFAQVDRSQYPEPGPAPTINIGDAETFTLPNGLKVFVVENHKLPRVTFSLVLDRDPILEGEKAGYIGMVGDLMMAGTEELSKEQLDEAIDQIGARIYVSSSSASASSLTKHQDRLLELFSAVLFKPSFPQDELDKIKKQTISGLAAAKDDPNAIASVVESAVMYGKDHPYGEAATEETVASVEVADIKNYYNTYFKPNIGYLAIVGDITKGDAEKLVKKYFSSWEKGEVPTHEWETVKGPASNQVILVDRPSSVQSLISVSYPIEMQHNDPNRIPASLMSYVLGGGSSSRLFLNLREDKGYTYGAYSSLSPDEIVGSFSANASVRTEVTDSAAYQFFYELDRLADKTITEEELNAAKAYLTGSFGRSLESPSTIASFALNTEIYDLPKDYYKNYLKNLDAVSVSKANDITSKYIRPDNAYLIIVGNVAEFEDQMAQFGEVKRYTKEGYPEEKKAVNADVTAEGVVSNYIESIGGAEKLQSVKSLRQTGEAEFQGMMISQEAVVDKDRKMLVQRTMMGGQEVSKVKTTQEKTIASAMGQEHEMPAEMHAAMKNSLLIFPELSYKERGVKLTLDGITQINGKDAYKLIVEDGSVKTVEYFDVESGLKVKTESATAGEIEYLAYKEFDGVKIPTTLSVKTPQLPAAMQMTMTNVEVNPTLTDADFE